MGTPIRPDVPLSPAEQLRRAQEPTDTGTAPAERLRQARDLTRDAEPTRAARVLRVQGQSAFPTDFVERNLDVLEKEVNQPTFDADRFWKESPAVAQWLAKDPTRVAATGRDIQRMGSVERYLRAIGTETERNKITVDLVEPSLAAMFGRATAEQETAIQTLRQRQAGLPNLGPEGFIAGIPVATIGQLPVTLSLYKGAAQGIAAGAAVGGAVGAVRGAPGGPAGVATGAATGAARGAFLGSRVGVAVEGMKLETAMAFLDYRELPNVDRETAAVGAMIAGVVAGALELVPFEAASKTIPGLRRLGKEGVREMLMAPTTRGLLQKYAGHILANMGAEGFTEGAQAMVTHVGKVLTQRAGDGTLGQLSPATLLRELFGDAEAWKGILAEARAGAQAGGGFATATQGVSAAVDFQAVRRAEQNASRMQAAAEAIHGNDRETAMTIAKDAPQAMQDAVASVGSDGAYFDINAFTAYWQTQTTPDGETANPRDVALALGVTAPEYDAALETQGTIRVLAERLLVDGMGSATHRQWFVDHLRSTPNELSRAEAQERVAAMDAEMEAAPEVPSRLVETDAAVELLREKLTTELRGARVQAQEVEAGVALWTETLRTAIERNPDIPVADIVRRFERVQVVAQPVAAMPDGRAVSAYEATNEKMDRGDGVQVPVLRSTRSARAQAARMQERLASKYNGDVAQMPEKERAQYEAAVQAALDAETLNKSLTPVDYATLRGPVVVGSAEQQAIVNVEANADVLEQAAFHGTPHNVDRFSTQFIGTGEGAQAYGWGLYFAQAMGVAEGYRRDLSNPNGEPLLDGRIINPSEFGVAEYRGLRLLGKYDGDVEQALGELYQKADDAGIPRDNASVVESESAIKEYAGRVRNQDTAGNLYQVDIPDAAVATYLDWDKPYAKQAKEVKEALKDSGIYKRYRDNLSNFASPQDTRGREPTGARIVAFLEWELGSPKAASEALLAAGIRGTKYLDAGSRDSGRGSRNLVVFDESDVTITHRNGEPVTAQERTDFLAQEAGTEPRGAFIAPAGRIDGPRLVALFKEKNQTTFLHESSHAFLDLWTDLANDPAASPQFRELVAGLRTELGATGTERLSVAQEEAFAGMFLDYAKTGKAPSLSLRQAFASFAAFLSKLWSFVKGEIVPANANVTDLLNRLLATDEAIEAAQGQFMAPLFPADMEINAAFVKARTFAEEQTRTEAMRTIVRAEQEWWKKESKRVNEEVRERVAQDPAYIARQAFTALQNPDGTALAPDSPFRAKLNKAQVVGILGDQATKALPRGKAGAVYATASEGMDVGTAATVLGYESASALLEAIRSTKPIEDHIAQVTDATMRERYGDPMTDGTIPEVAIEAVHNDALDQMRRLEIETIIRENPTQFRDAAVRAASRPLNLRELKAWAESHIAQIPLKALRPQQYESAERKATKDAVRAVAEGKWAEAVQAKGRQRMSAALYAEAIATRDRIAKAQKLFGKVLGNDEKIAARRNFDIVQAARQILASVGVGRKQADTAFYLQQLAEYDPATAETLQGVVAELNVPPRDSLRDLSVEEFDALAEAVGFLWRMSSDVNTLTIAGERVSKEQVLAPMMDRLREMKDSAVEGAGVERLSTWKDTANRKLLTVKAAGRRVESWADFMDGGDIAGPFRAGLFQEVRDQTANKSKAQAQDLERYEALVTAVRPHLAFAEIAAPELGRGKWVFKDTAHLLGALLHTGNPSNFQMFLDGRGWSKDQWFAFRDRMVAEGKLIPAHFDFVQGVWNLFEDKKPAAQQVYRRMFGKYFAEITREGFAVTFPDGTTKTYAGGYTPASKDPDASTAAEKRTADALLEEAYGMRFPTVQKGFTISRVQNAEPLLLSLDIVKKHLDATNKFIYLAEPVRQVGRLLRDREFRAEMDRVNPSLVNELLMPWLERSATQVVERPSGASPLARMGDGVAKYLRTTAGAGFMFLNVANTLEQATGLSVASVRVNPRYLSLAEANYLKDAEGVRGVINTASPFMDTRNTTQVGEVVRRIDVLTTNPNVFQKVQAFAQEHAYILQATAQNHVDTIVWYGSYMESLDKGLAESDAVKKADADVRLTQGSFDAVDVSAMEAGTPWFRLVAMFAGYFNMLANLNATEMAKAVEQMGVKRSIPRLFTVYGLAFAVPMLASNLLRRGLMGRAAFGDFDGEDDWGYLDDWFAWFFGEQARGLTAMAPPAGSAVNFLVAQFDDKPFNDQLSVSPALSFVESAGRGVKANYDLFTGDPFQRRDVRDMLALFTLMTRVPATGFARPLTYVYDVQTGKAEPSGPVDFTRGLLSGQPGAR